MFSLRQDNRLTEKTTPTAYNAFSRSMASIQHEGVKPINALLLMLVAMLLLSSTFLYSRLHRGITNADFRHMASPYGGGPAVGLTPQDLWKQYNLPGVSGGEGQLVAVVIDGGLPSINSDLAAYSQRFGLPSCTVASGCLTIKYQGGHPIPPGADEAEGTLDLETIHAVAPKAKLLLYSVQQSIAGLATGPSEIINTPGLKAINMSYGFTGNTQQYQSLYANNPNHVALFAASGDNGHTPTSHPASYPGVIAVGGTTLNGGVEAAWNGSGGGLSTYAEPAYQKAYGIPQANGMRGVPDVAAVAGTQISTYQQGRWRGMVGTSVAAPIWSGIAALVNKPITPELLYTLAKQQPDSFRDVTSGTNGRCGFVCTAHPGYDYITGLGTPRNFVQNVNAMP
ncbi:S53 family peptidase [Dictyobacter kobayashii]|uniref:Serine protease n=1 Tax=Dictyobacter kobayashii TaxID=2014872 RepID=A0A402ADC9_9CHLR|nr:S53 family peptidase [Dictyobacter kobayashii]GCE17104.1 serine protease [Dictyobacter kobayashii]